MAGLDVTIVTTTEAVMAPVRTMQILHAAIQEAGTAVVAVEAVTPTAGPIIVEEDALVLGLLTDTTDLVVKEDVIAIVRETVTIVATDAVMRIIVIVKEITTVVMLSQLPLVRTPHVVALLI
jgi:hypothetical protein